MRALFSLFIGLVLALSLGLGSVAHAVEPVGSCVEAGTTAGHVDGDSDQVPADSDKDYPHHHGGCHGHHVAAPIGDGETIAHARLASIITRADVRNGVTHASDPALRPPQA
ncbi:hypothetical protein G4G27_15475 [Sphingomonas sp. So64.6b]|uniref:hypothetical protein n=1 Tax=Sphingomonas sp. So64.6b TaxID=2997354 RepID=UPI0016026CE3|nr:hypothetical protein [Sphingomonas sp. So64.6b]QNA82565.1 hypothetical protein G4G27_15475 [Sphingomonas sp. So64.6b]